MSDPEVPAPPLDFSHVTIDAPLVSLLVVKQHLHITDSAHDEDITQKLEAAQELILAHLAHAADPAWTESTVPRTVRHAILILTSTFYEIRGGEDRDENLRKAWDAIGFLLSHYRDPALA